MRERFEDRVSVLFQYVVPIVAAIAAIVILLIKSADPVWMMGVILSLLIVLILSHLPERLVRMRRMERNMREGFKETQRAIRGLPIAAPVENFFKGIGQAPAFEQYARDATEIFVVGPTLTFLTAYCTSFFMEKARSGCEIKLLVMKGGDNPGIGLMDEYAVLLAAQTQSYLDAAHGTLRAWRDQARANGCNLEVKVYPLIPLSLTIVDGSKNQGRMLVTLIPYKVEGRSRPCFELTRMGQPDLFELFYSRYSEMWNAAEDL